MDFISLKCFIKVSKNVVQKKLFHTKKPGNDDGYTQYKIGTK